MNLPVFLDTSGLIAVVNSDDQWHSVAESVWASLIRSAHPLITTSLVLTEIGDGLSRVQHRRLAVDLYDRLRSGSRMSRLSVRRLRRKHEVGNFFDNVTTRTGA